MSIIFGIELCMSQREQVRVWAGVSDEQPVGGRVIRLEVKGIKVLLGTGGKRVCLSGAGCPQPAGKGNILDEQNMVGWRRDSYLIENVCKQESQEAKACQADQPGEYASDAQSSGFRGWWRWWSRWGNSRSGHYVNLSLFIEIPFWISISFMGWKERTLPRGGRRTYAVSLSN